MSRLDDPRQPPVLYFERMEIERRRRERRDQERKARVRRRWRAAAITGAVFVGLSIASALVWVSAHGQRYTKVVDLIVTQPLGRTPGRTLTVVAVSNSSPTAATSPRTCSWCRIRRRQRESGEPRQCTPHSGGRASCPGGQQLQHSRRLCGL